MVDLPSPSGVGVMPATTMYLPFLRGVSDGWWNEDVLSVLERLEDLELHLGLVASIHLEVVDGDTDLSSEHVDGLGGLRLGDLDVGRHVLLERELKALDDALLALLEVTLGSDERVLHKHGDGHGSNSAGDGRDERGDLNGRVVVDITDEALS